MKEFLPWLFLCISIFANFSLGTTLWITSTDHFLAVVGAAESIQDSRSDIQNAVNNFNSAVRKIEKVTQKVDRGMNKLGESIKKVRADIGRIEEVISF